MMKTCLFIAVCSILFSSTCRAGDIMIQKTPKGYIIMVQTATGKHCWGMPQHLDLSYIPATPMDIEAAATRFKWKTPAGKERKLCQQMKNLTWKVYSNQDQATQPVYKVVDNKDKEHNHVTDTIIDHISAGSACDGYIHNYGISNDLTYRQVTGKNGKQGAALCKEHH